MTKSEREEILSALTSRIFAAMLDDIVMDAALQSHHEITRTRAICHICNTRCGLVHGSGSSYSQSASHPSPSSVGNATTNGATGTGASTPTSIKTAEGNVLYECVNCKRQIASNRYAPHLSSCMGIGTGTRRGAVRNANVKTRISTEPGRSVSPYLGLEAGNASEDGKNPKGKSKSKSKRADDAEFNLKRKRPVSPQISPNKKQKKSKTAAPLVRVRSNSQSTNLQIPSSNSKVPSKLRSSSTVSLLEREQDRERSSSPSHSSSAGTPIASISTPTSSFSAHSPAGTGPPRRGRPPKNKANGVGVGRGAPIAPPKRPSPPRPPPPTVRIEPDYLIDVEGQETGSSTDTSDSS
ncbi:hypothetical protein SERLADRAFT_475482 [Serpula lacrymans var. lacrymans S7.9]|uniref:SAGA-associated factor 11 n=1 Tax=Serpula lacrymans var. lacrymans (strain S7.9) TaxID=578457 RepID=F8P6A5_SERL9|nr:uncharacterized protein SERLADRAFT_475482 [Serpula lacrymans var. lacrymans S7.9]EGO20972.1 hypothetical protein SERLADRAFT_475482 [Serpula lacrymans var. lacrymans S7.9]